MNLEANPLFVTLYFRAADYRDHGMPVTGSPRDWEYYPVISFPRSEMTADSVWAIGDDLVTLTFSQAWRLRARRHIEPGDLFTREHAVYMYADPTQLHELSNVTNVGTLDLWSHLHIVRLDLIPKELRKRCKVLI